MEPRPAVEANSPVKVGKGSKYQDRTGEVVQVTAQKAWVILSGPHKEPARCIGQKFLEVLTAPSQARGEKGGGGAVEAGGGAAEAGGGAAEAQWKETYDTYHIPAQVDIHNKAFAVVASKVDTADILPRSMGGVGLVNDRALSGDVLLKASLLNAFRKRGVTDVGDITKYVGDAQSAECTAAQAPNILFVA